MPLLHDSEEKKEEEEVLYGTRMASLGGKEGRVRGGGMAIARRNCIKIGRKGLDRTYWRRDSGQGCHTGILNHTYP